MKGRTKKIMIACGAIAVAGAAFLAFAGQRYGPFVCNACQIGAPVPDAATIAFINELRAPLEVPFIDRVWVVCNSSFCADYTPTDSSTWSNWYEGSNRRPQESGGGGGGGQEGGGGGGGSGGVAPGGGGGGGTGTPPKVIVGEDRPG